MSTNLHWINSDNLFSDICRNKKFHYTREEIEERAHKIHKIIWENRNEIWFDGVPNDPVEMLNPSIAATLIGFNYEETISLGSFSANGTSFEVAGLIDNKLKKILISSQHSMEVRHFTAAHELGHAVLHRENTLHRDRPLDGTSGSSRNETERQADWFATAFLMPEKLVRANFKKFFLTDSFALNENTAFALGYDYSSFVNRFKTLRQLSRILASTERYDNRHIVSLAKQFKVSDEAMAIRLEELGLLAI